MDTARFVLGFAPNLGLDLGDLLVLGYLDAGTGSLIFQVLVASLVSAGVVFGGLMTQLRGFFSRVVLRRRPELSATEPPHSSAESNVTLPGPQQVVEPAQQRKAA